jgi:ABC-2 type transport system ATP-binding protein
LGVKSMASIELHRVHVDFPVYHGGSRSLKKSVLNATTGGRIGRDAGQRLLVKALDGVSLKIGHGERIGLMGANGAGKTTLLRVLARIYEPTAGRVEIEGRISALFDVGLGFEPDATGVENIVLRGLYMGLRPALSRRHVREIAEFTELGDYLNLPVRTYSSGMLLRLAFAIATCITPDVLLMDEWMMAGDASFIGKAGRRLEDLVRQASILVLASHNVEMIRQWCDKAVLLDHGAVVAYASAPEVIERYRMNSRSP